MRDDMKCSRCGAYAPHYAECDACHAVSFPSDLAARALDVLRELVDNASYCQLEDDHEGRMMFVAALAKAEVVLKGS